MENLEKYVGLVENSVKSLNVNPKIARRKDIPYVWSLQRGSANIDVALNTVETHLGKRNIVVIIAPIMQVPENNRETLYRHLLELNHEFLSERFTIIDDFITVTTARGIDGLDETELVELIEGLGFVADSLDDYLKEQYSSTQPFA